MRHTIYIEADEEITSIIDKIKKSPEKEVAIVAPKGSLLLQSLVNLRILLKEGKKAKLGLDIVTTDSVGKNLALQAGLPVYKSLKDTAPMRPTQPKPNEEDVLKVDAESESTEDLPINYYKRDDDNESKPETDFESKTIEPIQAEKPENDAEVVNKKEDDKETQLIDASDAEIVTQQDGFVARSANEIHSRDSAEEIIEAPEIKSQREEFKEPVETHNYQREPEMGNRSNTPFRKIGAEKAKKRAIAFGVFIFIIFAILAVAAALLPQANITVAIKGEDFNKKIPVMIYGDVSDVVDSKDPYLLGKKVTAQADSESEYTATGKKDVGTKSSGDMVVYNEWDTLNHSFNAGTKFTNAGKVFVAKSAFTVPGATLSQGSITAGKVTVQVEASIAGDTYNLAPSKFTLDGSPNQSKMYGQTNEAMAGGTTKQLTIVSQEDVDKAKEEQTTKLRTALGDKIKAENKDTTLIDSAIVVELTEAKSSDNVGSEAEKFKYSVSGSGAVIIFNKPNLIAKAIEIARQDLDSAKTIRVEDGVDLLVEVGVAGLSDKSLPVDVELKGKVIPKFDNDALIGDLTFKSNSSTEEIIRREISNVEEVKISRFPGFWTYNSLLKSNISINLEYR